MREFKSGPPGRRKNRPASKKPVSNGGRRSNRLDPNRRGSSQRKFNELNAADMVAPICECCQGWIIGDGIKFADRLFCSAECLWLTLEVA